MIIKFKSGNTKIKFSCEGLSDNGKIANPLETIHNSYKDDNISFDTMFSKSDLMFLKKMYEKMPASVLSYYEYMNKAFEKYMNKSKPNSNYNNENDPNILPVNGHDIYNYAARYGIANFQIQTIMKLDGFLDYDKLVEAVRLSIEAEPIFGCHFVEAEPPYWKRLDPIDMTMFCSIEETDNLDDSVKSFLESPLDMDNDPMVKLKLLRSGQFDTLALKINHACCDGTGTKEYLKLLSDIYSTIDQENGVFEPKPSKRTRKEQDILFSTLGISNPDTAWIAGSDILTPTWSFPWMNEKTGAVHYEIYKLPNGQLDEMINYAKTKGAKINDLVVTAFSRAMLNMGESVYNIPLEIAITIDLRRYLPNYKTDAIRNFSGSVNMYIPMTAGETFEETLSRVIPTMTAIKNNNPGLQSAIGLERLEKLRLHEALSYFQEIAKGSCYLATKCMPSLSNLGYISKELIKFGQHIVTDAYIIPPVVNVPGILLMFSTYNDILTLTVSYYEGTIQKVDIEKLLLGIKQELVEGCKQ